MERTSRCSKCRYWSPEDETEGAYGQCRRHAPVPMQVRPVDGFKEGDEPEISYVVPLTKYSFWCGDYQKKEVPK